MDLSFVHIPRTGGTSIDVLVETEPNSGNYEKMKKSFRGHYPTSFFQKHLREYTVDFMTFIRDPYQIYSSFYYFYKQNGTPLNSVIKQHVTDAHMVMHRDITIEQYFELIKPNSLYTSYIDSFPISQFAFVGNADEMDKSINLFNAMFNPSYSMPQVVIDPDGVSFGGPISANQDKAIGEPYGITYPYEDFVAKNQLDYEIYNAGLERFNQLHIEHL